MEREGFIDTNNNDKLELRFYVRPPSYSQLARDLKNYACTLEKKVRHYNNDNNNEIRTSQEIAINQFNMINHINNTDQVNENGENENV